MAFNANTYRMNKYRREAWAALGKAREAKARLTAGDEGARYWVESGVLHARIGMRLFRSARTICNLTKRSA